MKNVSEKIAANCPFYFLTPRHEDGDIVVAKKEWFTDKSIGDTYTTYGQSVDTDEVGEYDVLAYNYHDGNNWQSIILNSPQDEDIDFDIISEQDAILSMWEAIESNEFVKEHKGIRYYVSEKFTLTHSAWQGSWALFTIEEK